MNLVAITSPCRNLDVAFHIVLIPTHLDALFNKTHNPKKRELTGIEFS